MEGNLFRVESGSNTLMEGVDGGEVKRGSQNTDASHHAKLQRL